jgi:transcription elongation factor GreA
LSKVPLTARGAEQLREELRRLKSEERPRVVNAIAEARSHGDLRENAAYDAARQDQAMNEKRIADLEALLRTAVVVEEGQRGSGDVIQVGSTVVVVYEGDDEEETYTIVGAIEAKPSQGRISNESPIGRALIGKRPGQSASVVTPGGTQRLTVKRIER